MLIRLFMVRSSFVVVISMLPVALLLWLLLYPWQPIEDGPDLEEIETFYGCYQNGPNKLSLSNGDITILRSGQSTKVKRFFYLKSDAAINTVNNLQYVVEQNTLRIGDAETGFFYRFDDPTVPTALLIPDDEGEIRKFARAPC